MMKFFRSKFLVFTMFYLGISCTSVNDFFGNAMIPPSQVMDTYIDSTMAVRTSLFSIDSMVGNTAGTSFVGSYIDPLTGRTSAKFFTSYINMTPNTTDSLFGDHAVMDSMKIKLVFNPYVGDTSTITRITIYPMKDSVLNPNQAYYTNTNAELFYDKTTPLVTFDLKGESSIVANLPRWFFEKFYYARPLNEADKKTNPYYVDSLFVKIFKGLYFSSEDATPGGTGGKMASINMGYAASSLKLYYHNENTTAAVRQFMFYNPDAYYTCGFQVIDHDYSLSDPAAGGVVASTIGDATLSVPTAYIQSITGLGARVVLDTTHFSVMRERAAKDGFKHIAIHRAELKWKIKEMSAANYDRSYTNLVLYYDLMKRSYLPDYPNIQDPSTGKIINPMVGVLHRATGYYIQNITSTIQQLITGKLTDNTVQLLPSVEQIAAFKRSAVYGSGATDGNAPQLIITYTLLR